MGVGVSAPRTVISPEVPVMEEVSVSVAVTVWVPTVANLTRNPPVPLDRVELTGRIASPSVEANCTVPA